MKISYDVFRYFAAVFMLITILFMGCKDNSTDPGEDLSGAYTGTISGTPVNGNLTLIVTKQGDQYTVSGNWYGENNYAGKINSWTYNASGNTLNISYDNGLGMTAPMSILCPGGQGSYGCYDSGATLGNFKGQINKTSGTGTYSANTGAAQYLGLTGSGTWSVTRK